MWSGQVMGCISLERARRKVKRRGGGEYEFIIRPNTPQNHPITPRCTELTPLFPMLRIMMYRIVIRPIDPRRLRIPYVGHIIDVILPRTFISP